MNTETIEPRDRDQAEVRPSRDMTTSVDPLVSESPAAAPPSAGGAGAEGESELRGLVPLCDGRPGVRSGLAVQTSLPPASPGGSQDPEGPPWIDFIASSEMLDRYGEILTVNGWRLDQYRRNPVFQNAHQYGDIIFTLGKALTTEVREVGGRLALCQRIEFAVELNPMARIAYGLYRGRFLNAVSVGFVPLRWEDGGAEAGFRRRYLEQELLEVSAVSIPANPEALQLGLRSGAIQKADLRELLALLAAEGRSRGTCFCGRPAGLPDDPGAQGEEADGARWLRLARAIRAVIGAR